MLIIAALVIALAAALAFIALYGAWHWQAATRALEAKLLEARLPPIPATYDPRELEGLPAPVQRYFRAVLREGQPIVASAEVAHAGSFDMGAGNEKWRSFRSTQRVVTRRPGFVWNARIAMMPGLPVRVHDAYVAGEGLLHAALFGLFTVADMRGSPEIAEGELMRFLAESAWYPTALLPSQGVRWHPVDDGSADATLTDGDIVLTMRFRFDEAGLIDSVRAESRGRAVDGVSVPTPWEGRWRDYQWREGMRVPIEGEVAWLLPDGPKPYWRGRITDLRYEFAR